MWNELRENKSQSKAHGHKFPEKAKLQYFVKTCFQKKESDISISFVKAQNHTLTSYHWLRITKPRLKLKIKQPKFEKLVCFLLPTWSLSFNGNQTIFNFDAKVKFQLKKIKYEIVWKWKNQTNQTLTFWTNEHFSHYFSLDSLSI